MRNATSWSGKSNGCGMNKLAMERLRGLAIVAQNTISRLEDHVGLDTYRHEAANAQGDVEVIHDALKALQREHGGMGLTIYRLLDLRVAVERLARSDYGHDMGEHLYDRDTAIRKCAELRATIDHNTTAQ